jgi:hypothetical protein
LIPKFASEAASISSELRNRSSRPESRENGMKDATRRATSEVFAQMMAVTAMVVIASVVFYWR